MVNYPIVRMYPSLEQANAAVAALKDWGFDSNLINVVTAASRPGPNAPASAASDDPVQSAIMAGYVLKAHAKAYADTIRRGGVLVTIRPPFGTGGFAEQRLDECHPIASGVNLKDNSAPSWDEAAPLSSALRLPVQVKSAAPFSAFWVLPVVSRRGKTLGTLSGIPELSSSASYLFGSPALSKSAAPFSAMFKMPLLTGEA